MKFSRWFIVILTCRRTSARQCLRISPVPLTLHEFTLNMVLGNKGCNRLLHRNWHRHRFNHIGAGFSHGLALGGIGGGWVGIFWWVSSLRARMSSAGRCVLASRFPDFWCILPTL